MDTKHTPATPLPHATAGYSVYPTWRGPTDSSIADFKNRDNAAYYVHAANAYPKLVKAVKDAIAVARPDSVFLASHIALLRELGESE